jgi:hypothetical protein
MKNNSTPAPVASFAVSLQSAETAITAFCQQFPNVPTKAFTIHADDFLGALGYTPDQIQQLQESCPLPYRHARLYLGLDQEVNSLKLFLVPVADASINPDAGIVAGTDIIPDGTYQGYSDSAPASGQYVYDLIAPCPGTCDTSSALYLAGNATNQ